MSTAHTRGRIAVSRDSWMWRWYDAWAKRKGDHRSVVDLCHFIRVLLIFGPCRWFFQATYTRFKIEPVFVILATSFITTLGFAIWRFPGTMKLIGIFGTLLLTAVAIVVTLILGFIRWREIDPDRADEVLVGIVYWGFIWLWGPIWLVFRAVRWFWFHALHRPMRRVFTRPLFHVSIGNNLISVWIYALLIGALYGAALVLNWENTLALTGIAIGIALGAAILFVGGGWVYDTLKARSSAKFHALPFEKRMEIMERIEHRPKREWRTLKLFWAWAAAKKHRICPLIEPTNPTT